MDNRLKLLIRKRAPLKGRITNVKNYLNKPLEEQFKGELIEKCENLKGIRESFETIQSEIEALVASDEEFDNEQKEREKFEEDLCLVLAKVKAHIDGNLAVLQSVQSLSSNNPSTVSNTDTFLSASTVSTNDSNASTSGTNNPNNILTLTTSHSALVDAGFIGNESNYRIPKADLPKFEGSYEKWPGFSDTFKSAVHKNSKLSDAEKLMYLRSCLLGRAADKIETLETTAANYQVAWSILEKYYDDPAAVVNNRIRALFELTPCQNASALSLGEILDNATKHYRALEALKKPFLEAFPIYLVLSKLDHQTRIKWKEHVQDDPTPTMTKLLDFLHSRRKVLETHKTNKNERMDHFGRDFSKNNSRGYNQNSSNRQTYALIENDPTTQQAQSSDWNSPSNFLYTTQFKPFCHLCKGSHFTQYCEQLVNVSVPERINIVKRANLCFNCLKSNHGVEDCKSTHCKTCNKRHHSLLHYEREKPNQSTHLNTFCLKNNTHIEKLLTTAVLYIADREGTPQKCRFLLDSCSQPHILTERMASKLGLQKSRINIPLGAINSLSSSIKYIASTRVKSRLNDFSLNLEFLIVNEVNECLPSTPIDKSTLNIPRNITLADPSFYSPGPIDGIIGAEYFLQILKQGQIRVPGQDIVFQNTVFGWIVAGKIFLPSPSSHTFCHLITTPLNEQLEKFWAVENCPEKKVYSIEETECEAHYQRHTTRIPESGQYSVKLPFRENVSDLGESYSSALKRLSSLERSFIKKPDLKAPYIENLQTYITDGYMTELNSADTREGYYLPHHAVIKQSSSTTKVRVVFDGSSKTATGLSLNDVLMVGPTIQNDLFSLLVRFRSHAFVLTADIEKMYLQTKVHPEDRKYQRILWREDSSQPVKIFELNTATFGTSAAPFLAIRSLHQLANDEADSYPKAAAVLKSDFYVDDLLTGASTREEAEELRDELIGITRKGGLNLRKWSSNDPHLIETMSHRSNESQFQLNLENETKTLGIHWNPERDSIGFTVNQNKENKTVTKRVILSQIAQLIDPLGLLGPVTVLGKILMQRMWLLKLDWDTPVSTEIYNSWCKYRDQLPFLLNFQFSRKFLSDDYVSLQLHGFSDASEKAFGACIFIRSISSDGKCETHLVCSKSRVAPLKTMSLPRLELSAALLLAQLYQVTAEALKHLKFEKTIFWADSTIALHWINTSPHELKTFVSNRVSNILEITSKIENGEWRHVRSENNPADLISRGLLPEELIVAPLWQHGPQWLSDSENRWPKSVLEFVEVPEKKQPLVSFTLNLNEGVQVKNTTEKNIDILKHFSSSIELKRFIACCKRVTQNAKSERKMKGELTVDELKNGMTTIVKLIQSEGFPDELKCLQAGKQLEEKLTNLSPFIDSEGVLRVGGRLDKSNLPFSKKHPALLPSNHHFTEILIREKHVTLMHGGTQATLNALHENFWIVNGRSSVRKVIHKCILCARAQPTTLQYVMGNLPRNRLALDRPFSTVGVDYCGPFYIKEKRHRNRNKLKVYAAIFVCFATKAVHIELVSDLTTEAFLAALRRFFSRRGLSSDIYSDNGTNFVGARNEIEEIQELLTSDAHNRLIRRTLANRNVAWHVIPPRSPHFGGLWEAAVKSFKHHFMRVIGDTLLTYEDLSTLTTEIEAILNSRPLTPLSSDPNDLSALTPGHFLIRGALANMPERNLMDIPFGRLSSWEQVRQMRQHFWNRWNKEYLHELNVRKKWHNGKANDVKVGDLVTLKEENLPPLKWSLGRIIAVHPGSDKIVRVVTVKTHRGEYKRCVKKISPLPFQANDVV